MARCDFARWDEINGGVGSHAGGPFKIVHHTTEGTTYAGARDAYAKKRADPHFTVCGDQIYQHIDTEEGARALRNAPDGVETNRDSSVQIELVARAAEPKDPVTLRSVAKLCRWIERQHDIPQTWPNGFPRASVDGHDPGEHNRNARNWNEVGGHYGHSQVPENDHWDPGYTETELHVITPGAFSSREVVSSRDVARRTRGPSAAADPAPRSAQLAPPAARAAERPASLAEPPPKDQYLDRLLKYVPVEVVALYVGLRAVVDAAPPTFPKTATHWGLFGILLVGTWLWLSRVQKVSKRQQLAISTLAFAIWAFALGEPFTGLFPHQAVFAALLVPLYTFFAAVIEADA